MPWTSRKLAATISGILGLIGNNVVMAIYTPDIVSLTTAVLTIIGITGLAGYEIKTQGLLDNNGHGGQ
jgi:uncharacterized membrane protein YuzA (DUF378 family)